MLLMIHIYCCFVALPSGEIIGDPAPNVFPRLNLSFADSDVRVECEVASLADGAARLKCGEPLLQRAVRDKRLILIQLLLNLDGHHQLSLAQRFDCLDCAMDLQAAQMLMTKADFFPLHRHLRNAIIAGHPELLHLLLTFGGGYQILIPPEDLDQPPPRTDTDEIILYMETLLTLACGFADVDCVQVLLDYGRRERVVCDPFAPPGAPAGTTLSRLFNVDVVEMDSYEHIWPSTVKKCECPIVALIKGYGAGSAPALPNGVVYTPDNKRVKIAKVARKLHRIPRGTTEAKFKIMAILHDFGFDFNQRSGLDGFSPLMAGVESGSSLLVDQLLAYKCRISPGRINGLTQLHLACQMQNYHLLPSLLHAARAQHSSASAWGPSIQSDGVSINHVDEYGRTCLDIVIATLLQHSGSVEPMLGADINDKNRLVKLRELIFQVHGGGLLELSRPLPEKKGLDAGGCTLFDFCSCATASRAPPIVSMIMDSSPSKEYSFTKPGRVNSFTTYNSVVQAQINPQRAKVLEEATHAMLALDGLLEAGARTKLFPMRVVNGSMKTIEEENSYEI